MIRDILLQLLKHYCDYSSTMGDSICTALSTQLIIIHGMASTQHSCFDKTVHRVGHNDAATLYHSAVPPRIAGCNLRCYMCCCRRLLPLLPGCCSSDKR